ncbi:CidA/LrgA family protein [Neobacillus niacini]|uniref:CidA/LrgA family protein n=1 Tax=Neobacillus niacini TaxID=86668 RepID=UPI002041BF90|nr:CidA/LrgA family protein [Neobacillus niacini]MCM3694606.1 CidA/LrgA family protein [Neobacillus niacini]
MKILIILLQTGILSLFYLVGTIIHNLFDLVIPGSIIGLILLFLCLCLKIIPVTFIENGAGFLLSILVLFFIPATVGIMNYSSLLSFHGALFISAILLSTIFTIGAAGIAGQLFEKKAEKRKDEKEWKKPYSHSG